MLQAGAPKFRRRKADRPGEIIEAAMMVFAEKGFAAAKLDDIARQAGVSKGALYLYFETKEDIFRAVVAQAITPNMQAIRAMIAAHPGPLPDLLRNVAERVGGLIESLPVAESAWKRCLEIGERPDLDGAVAGRGGHMAAHNLAVFYETLGRAQEAGDYAALAKRLRG